MKLKATCNICGEVEIVNGQNKFYAWKRKHIHNEKQTEIDYKSGYNCRLQSYIPDEVIAPALITHGGYNPNDKGLRDIYHIPRT